MDSAPGTVTAAIAILALFLICIVALKYAVQNRFNRMRLGMTAFFLFVVATLTLSFWRYTIDSLPYAVPALIVGVLVGHLVAVREAERKLLAQGLEEYLEHVGHIHFEDLAKLRWWSLINVYTIMGSLALINLIGVSTVLSTNETWAIITCAIGAFGVGTIAPYLFHLWAISAKR